MARNMKDTGIAWLGQIPEEWSIRPIKECFNERSEKVSDYDWEPLSVTKQGIVKQLESAAKSDAHDARKKVCKGDFVINSRSDRKQSCGLSDYDGSVSLINIVLRSENLYAGYVKYLLKNYGFAEEFYRWGTGIVDDLWSTNYQRMKRIMIPVPTYIEQEKIGNFLDEKIPEIDGFLSKTRTSIEEYRKYKQAVITEAVTKGLEVNIPFKESGIKWIGKIPKEFMCVKLRHCVQKIGDVDHYMPETVVEGIPYVMTGDLEEKVSEICFDRCKMISEDDYAELSKKITAQQGDVILARYATIGTVSYVDIDKRFIVSYSCVVIKPKKELNGKFLYYYSKSSAFEEELKKYTNSNTQGNVGIDSLYQAKIVLPSMDRQEEIVEYLDAKCAEIDALIAKKEVFVDEMEAYKKSLIYEYVTGKKEV